MLNEGFLLRNVKAHKMPSQKLKPSSEPSTDRKPPTDQDRAAEGRGFAAWGRSPKQRILKLLNCEKQQESILPRQ